MRGDYYQNAELECATTHVSFSQVRVKYKNKKKLILTIKDALRHHEEVEGAVDRGEDGVVWSEPNGVKIVKRGFGGDIFEEDVEKGLFLLLLI